MIKIGILGDIGSGKSYVAQNFGYPIFNADYEVAKRLMPKGSGSVIACGLKGGRQAGQTFIESVQVASHLANVGDAKTLVIHPGSTTQSHLSPEAMKAAGLTDDMLRISVGLEDFDDLKSDFEQALSRASKARG